MIRILDSRNSDGETVVRLQMKHDTGIESVFLKAQALVLLMASIPETVASCDQQC